MKNRTENGISTIVEPLLEWYSQNKRSLPWREAPSPYHVWVSEIMLQQTRIEAVIPYYNSFLKKLPTIGALAAVDDDELMKLWEGLGYYSRARNLKKAAVVVTETCGGELPADFEMLVSLPGIGRYTAGAIASIAFGLPEPAVDGNVLRVLMRYQNRDDDVMSQRLRREVEETLREIMPVKTPGLFTEALMELGEVICIPGGEPRCAECPLRETCQGLAAGRAGELPVRRARTGRRVEKRTILRLVDADGNIFIRKRPDKGLLAGLWELPSVEGRVRKKDIPERVTEILRPTEGADALQILAIKRLPDARHIFSHLEWDMVGYEVRLATQYMGEGLWVNPQDLEDDFALPTAFSAYHLRE